MRDYPSAIPDLQAIRKRRGISLREIADATKIRVFYLEAIEKGEYQKLPGGVYTTSYIRQYAKAIDFEEDELLRAVSPAEGQNDTVRPVARTLFHRLFRYVLPMAVALIG